MRRPRLVAVLLAAIMAALLGGCGLSGGLFGGLFGADPRDAGAAFLEAVARGDAAGAGRLTDNPVAATELIQQVRDELKPQRVQLSLGDVRSGDHIASASFSALWDLGRGRQWHYSGAFELVPSHSTKGWLVRWSPAVLHPGLGARQRVTLREVPAEPAQVLDRAGMPILTSQTGLGWDFVSPLVPGIRRVVEKQLADAAGWRIVTVTAMGAEVDTLAAAPPRPVPTLTTTVDRTVQVAAEHAVDGVATPAMIVAIQPSTGEILAVAQNAAADAQGALSLTGRFPPGSAFKIVTAAAALQSKQVTPDSPVACPATTSIGERIVPNDHLVDLGTVPLHTAFARSCDTTFAQLAARLGAGALTDAANQMGIGINYDIAGAATFTGQVPPSESMVRRAENGFGQGRVLVSPFGMALVASTVAAGGRLPTPILIREIPTQTALGPVPSVPREVADAVRTMMREAVTQGTAKSLAGQGQLFGKTGTAEDDPAGADGWFVGFRGDLAFATLVVNAGSATPVLDISGLFLSALGPV
ncbi:MAG: penicillin-binding transpeptidase domain-containing protein [Pseudonocardiaceae bacterium]